MPELLAPLVRIARKLRGRSLDEVRVRSAQALAAWRERRGLAFRALAVDDAALARRIAAGQPDDAAALLDAFRARAPHFFPAFDDPDTTIAALAARCPDDRSRVLHRAERVLAGQFDVLGYTGLSYGAPVDWARDPVHERQAPLVHWSRVPYLDPEAVGDHKVTWEINRQQYLVTLGQAFWYTRDVRYARGFAEYVTAWMNANPPKLGINWASSLEVSFRAMSWIWALHFFRDADVLTPALYSRMLRYLHVHASHLEQNLSTYFSPNTHLTGEALGLVFIGALVPELAGAARWRNTGLRVLANWLPRQVRADGGYFEQATQYHRYTTEFTLELLVLDARHGWGLAPILRPILIRLLDYLQAVTRPGGTIPLVGDDDGGKLVDVDGRPPDDVRGIFAQAAAFLDSAECAYAAGAVPDAWPAALWVFGTDGASCLGDITPEPPTVCSQAFVDTGMYVMRDGWTDDASHAVIDCGPHGVMNGGHAHADLLSMVVSARGWPLLIDSGTFCYVGPERNAFRRAEAHNTLLVDGEGSSVPAADAFQWSRVAHGRAIEWATHTAFTFFEGTHDGFRRLPDPVVHQRAVLFLPGFGWVVRDRINASGAHAMRANWHLAPELTVTPDADGRGIVATTPDATVQLRIAAFASGRGHLRPSVDDAWISPRYGARERATQVAFEQHGAGPQELTTFLLPSDTKTRSVQVREVDVGDAARVFVIRATNDGEASETDRGDAAFVIIGQQAGWTLDLMAVASAELALQASDVLPTVSGDGGWVWMTRTRSATHRDLAWRVGLGPGTRVFVTALSSASDVWRVAHSSDGEWLAEAIEPWLPPDAA